MNDGDQRSFSRVSIGVTVACSENPDHYELTVRYQGDPEAGGVSDAVADDADLSECPVCGADTDSESH